MTDFNSDSGPAGSSVLWLWILAGFAAALAIVLLFSSSVLSFISQVFGVRAIQLGLRVRSSALFNWMLLVLDFAIAVFFLVLLLVTVSLLFDGFHKHRDNLLLAGQAHEGAIGMSLLVWASLAARVACFVCWRRCSFCCVRSVDVDYRVDPLLLALAAMSSLWAFPWPSMTLSRETTGPPLLSFAVLSFLLYVTVQLRMRLHRQLASIPVVTSSCLHHQAPCDGADGVTHVDVCNLKAGGWSVDDLRIFVRQQAADHWRWMQELVDPDSPNRCLVLHGPPGTGKSTVTWAWACFVAQTRPVVWGHRSRDGGSVIALLGGGRVSYYTIRPEDRPTLARVMERIAHWAGADVMILDGLRNTETDVGLRGSAHRWANERGHNNRRTVTVSSAQMDAMADDNPFHARQETLYSWTLDEYRDACEDDPLWDKVKVNMGWVVPAQRGAQDDRNQAEFMRDGQQAVAAMTEAQYKQYLIILKFEMAGGSARWMFFLSIAKLIDAVETWAGHLHNFEDIANGLAGHLNELAVGHCVAVYSIGARMHRVQIISHYVGRFVTQKCSLAFFHNGTIRDLNPAHDGWILEGEFLCRVRLAESGGNDGHHYVTVHELGNQHNNNEVMELRLPVAARIFFNRALDEIANANIQDNMWFIPALWNQGGYDAAFYQAEHRCLFCLQITANQNHDEKWTAMNKLAWAVTRRLVAQAVPGDDGQLPDDHVQMDAAQQAHVEQHGVQFVEHLYVLPPDRVDGFVFRNADQIGAIPFWRHTHTRKVAFARIAGAPAPQANHNQIIGSRGSVLGQDGGLYPREPGNHDWRRNFPLRPE